MKQCTDSKLGALLHAYELKTLSEEEIERFEIHLLECEYCFDEVQSFAEESSILASDVAVKNLIAGFHDSPLPAPSAKKRLWHLLWPSETPYFLRPAILYIIILLMIIPVFRGLMSLPDRQVRPIQAISLLPIRSAEHPVLRLSVSKEGLINFAFDGAESGKSYIVEIKSIDGGTIYMDSDYREFDRFQTGRLVLPISRLKTGDYILTITDPAAKPPYDRKEYSFIIAK
jgi:hypothetical protein